MAIPLIWKIVAPFVLVVGLFIGGYWMGYHKAGETLNAKHQAAYASQIVKGASDMYAAAEATAAIERDYRARVDALMEQISNVHTEMVVKYVQGPSKKCPVSPELERAHDAVSGLLNDRPDPADPLPAAADPTGVVAEPQKAELTDVALLSAYERAVGELASLWEDYSSLVEWVRESHKQQIEASGRTFIKEAP